MVDMLRPSAVTSLIADSSTEQRLQDFTPSQFIYAETSPSFRGICCSVPQATTIVLIDCQLCRIITVVSSAGLPSPEVNRGYAGCVCQKVRESLNRWSGTDATEGMAFWFSPAWISRHLCLSRIFTVSTDSTVQLRYGRCSTEQDDYPSP